MKPAPSSPPGARCAWKRFGAGVLIALLVAVLLGGGLLLALRERIVLAAEAYLYGYPLVLMDLTRSATAATLGLENRLHRLRRFPDAHFRGVVRPNVDTLYTSAFIDMAQGPWVFEMAANAERYEVMPFMDAWTNVFAAPGTRSSGSAGGRFLLAGPGWHGALPDGLALLRSPTRMVWLIGRTESRGVADYPRVHRLQDGITLRSLVDWQAGRQPPQPPQPPEPSERSERSGPAGPAGVAPQAPVAQLQAMGVDAFFDRLAGLMVDNPPAPADATVLMKLARLGVAPGRPPHWSRLERWSAELGRRVADWKVVRELQQPRDLVRGWATPPAILGDYGTAYNVRAAVARVGLGANLPADAIYPNTRVDAGGAPLNGSHRYRLHFAPGALPPVHAFWSVTAYGADEFLIDNPRSRYALGDRDPLVFNADGSLDLWLQADAPSDARQSNWLPVRAGEAFGLTARLYWPELAALTGAWGMPAVERLD